MKIKVCGMRDPGNVESIAALSPDYLGFIFYPKSKRYVGDHFNANDVLKVPSSIKKVGVFVNETLDEIVRKAKISSLDLLQLHGDESPALCATLKNLGYGVIKAFQIDEGFDFHTLQVYDACCDYFLFDTACKTYGGSGKQFNWSVLSKYKLEKGIFLSGGIDLDSIQQLRNLNVPIETLDINSRFELSPALKDVEKVSEFIHKIKTMSNYSPNKEGYYGEFGGAFIPEMLQPNVDNLQRAADEFLPTTAFKDEFKSLLKDYCGRPSPLYFSKRMSEQYGAKIYLKREDLNHTGSHKVNNTIGQILLAKKMGKKRIIAETGAGQHGVATATVCALMDLECIVYMGATDVERQMPNVKRMEMLGAEVRPAISGNKTLKDATNEAIRDWINNPTDTYYLIGSVVGPHPYPSIVAGFQSIISEEIKEQLLVHEGKENPDYVLACVGGGSNAAGAFYHFLDETSVKLVAVEAAGLGVDSGETAATTTIGDTGFIHGSKTLLMQTDDGQIVEPYSISAGLDYPGIGPIHAHLFASGRGDFLSATDQEALDAAFLLTRLDGIIPALESAHALAALEKIKFKSTDIVVVNLSGRGDKDMDTYIKQMK